MAGRSCRNFLGSVLLCAVLLAHLPKRICQTPRGRLYHRLDLLRRGTTNWELDSGDSSRKLLSPYANQPLHANMHAYYENAFQHTCGAVMRVLGMPRVALLFLTVGDLPHDALWRAWLGQVAGKLPVQALLHGCNISDATVPEAFRAARGLVSPFSAGAGDDFASEAGLLCKALVSDADTPPYYRQLLYTLYAHAPPAAEFSAGSLLAGRRIAQRVPSMRLSHTLVTVERHLVRVALADPLNQRFVMLSESQMPLYPAPLVYQQLLHEPLARVDACPPDEVEQQTGDVMSWWRWKDSLGPREFWRKSSHWISMTRPVADFFLHEREVDAKFEAHCDPTCSNIEHYIPTMLATHNLSHLTSCARTTTYVDWSVPNPEGRPKTFHAADLTPELLRHARKVLCNSDPWAAKQTAAYSFIHVASLGTTFCEEVSSARVAEYEPLDVKCHMFIRKVAADAADVALKLFHTFEDERGYDDAPLHMRP